MVDFNFAESQRLPHADTRARSVSLTFREGSPHTWGVLPHPAVQRSSFLTFSITEDEDTKALAISEKVRRLVAG